MKKLISLALLIIICLMSFTSCSDDEKYFEPIESTENESRTLATMTVDGNVYEIKNELYTALFNSYKTVVAATDDFSWSNADTDTIERISSIVLERAADIFATLSLAKSLGFDPYSESANELVRKYIYNGVMSSFGGNYEAYLAALAKQKTTYAVSDLLIRYELSSSYIDSIACPNYDSEVAGTGAFFLMSQTFTRDDVKKFYYSSECNRVLGSYIPSFMTATVGSSTLNAEQLAAMVHSSIDRDRYEIDTVREHLAKYSPSTSEYELQNGFVFGKYSSDYRDLSDVALSLDTGELSGIVYTHDGRYYILFGIEKSDAHFTKCYDDIKNVFVKNKIGEMKYSRIDKLIDGLEKTDAFDSIDYGALAK